jgi:hypothetical protein
MPQTQPSTTNQSDVDHQHPILILKRPWGANELQITVNLLVERSGGWAWLSQLEQLPNPLTGALWHLLAEYLDDTDQEAPSQLRGVEPDLRNGGIDECMLPSTNP